MRAESRASSTVRVLEPAVEVGVLQGGAHLLAQRHEEPLVERGERIARVAHQHQGADTASPRSIGSTAA